MLLLEVVFWLALATWFIVETVLVEVDEGGWALVVAIGFWASFSYFTHSIHAVWAYAKGNLLHILIYLSVYIVVGAVWSFPRWFIFLYNQKDKYSKWLAEWTASVSGNYEYPNRLKTNEEKQTYLAEQKKYAFEHNFPKGIPPVVSHYKADIVRWMCWWPFSAVGTFWRKFLSRIWEVIFNFFSGWYQKMSNSVFEGIEGIK